MRVRSFIVPTAGVWALVWLAGCSAGHSEVKRTRTTDGTRFDAGGIAPAPDGSSAAPGSSIPQSDAGSRQDAGTACTGAGTNPVCQEPPAARCLDETTRELYGPRGSCVNGSCAYTPTERPCFGGCTRDGCVVCPGPGGEVVEDSPRLDHGEPERQCWSAADLGNTTRYPHRRTESDAGPRSAPAGCPPSSELEWGPIGETCAPRPECDAPIAKASDAGLSECCYIVYTVCGV